MNRDHKTLGGTRIRRPGSGYLILALLITLLPALAVGSAGAQADHPLPVLSLSEIRYPISDLKIGLWFEGVPAADPDNLRWNEIDDPAAGHDGDATYIVTTHIKSYRAGIVPPTVPADATNISVSIVWTGRYEVADTFHVSWSQLGVSGAWYFRPTHNPGTTYTTFTDTWTSNPATGLAWTPATANTVSGLGFDSNVESAVHVTQGYIQISYETGAAAPAIDVEKYVWNGTTWLDADDIPGPYLPPGTDPQFKFVVTNTGNVTLSNVDLTDNVYGNISLDGTLAAGTSAEYLTTGTWAAGQHTNTATASGDFSGNTYSDTDDANYFGSPVAPAIDVEKHIWDGTTWVDADTGSGPVLLSGTDPLFRFVVTNIGNVALAPMSLSDSPTIANFYADPGLTTPCAIPTSLDPQATVTCYGSLPWAKGRQTDTGTATGDLGGDTYSDTDDANYFGGAPAIDVEKYIWDGTTWLDADDIPGPSLLPGSDPEFKFVVTNTGNVTLGNVDLTDNVYGDISLDGTLAAGTSAEYLTTGTWAAGQHTNTATASGDFSGNAYSDTDDANYFGATLALALVKTADPATYDSVGDVIAYSYLLTNNGNVPLEAPFTVTDDKVSATCPGTPASLAPGASITCTASYIITQPDLDAGSVTNTARGHGSYGGTPVDSNWDDETVTAILPAKWWVYLPMVFGNY